MRNPERIEYYLSLIKTIQSNRHKWSSIDEEDYVKIITYWKNNPDQRLGQMLYNLRYMDDSLYYKECYEILHEKLDIPYRDLLYWKRSYNERNEKIPTEHVLIKDLDTDHIKAIIIGVLDKKFIKPSKVYWDTLCNEIYNR